jgi:hypothetical protein
MAVGGQLEAGCRRSSTLAPGDRGPRLRLEWLTTFSGPNNLAQYLRSCR